MNERELEEAGTKPDNGGWTRRDMRYGLLLLVAGGMIGSFAWMLSVKDWPSSLWVPIAGLAAVLLILGANGTVRSLRADA